jgi:hypothetical protein
MVVVYGYGCVTEKLDELQNPWIYWIETQRPAGVNQRVQSVVVTLR